LFSFEASATASGESTISTPNFVVSRSGNPSTLEALFSKSVDPPGYPVTNRPQGTKLGSSGLLRSPAKTSTCEVPNPTIPILILILILMASFIVVTGSYPCLVRGTRPTRLNAGRSIKVVSSSDGDEAAPWPPAAGPAAPPYRFLSQKRILDLTVNRPFRLIRAQSLILKKS